MRALIKEKKEIAKGTSLIAFDIPRAGLEFKAGQFIFVTLLNPPYQDDRGPKRQFSIVNSPNQKGVIQIAFRQGPSAFKRSILELPPKTEVELGPVSGIIGLPQDTTGPLVFIAGGIGITTFISMLRFAKETGSKLKITLFYANPTVDAAAFFEELKELENNKRLNFKLVPIITRDPNWQGEKRHIDKVVLKQYLQDIDDKLFYVVGPSQMVKATYLELKNAQVPPTNIKIENYTGY